MKTRFLLATSVVLLAVSAVPLFSFIREFWVENQLNKRYEIHHAYKQDGFERIIDRQNLLFNDKRIQIIEEKTGEKASLTPWDRDENVPPGEIVKIHFLLNGKEISEPDEIWLSNRNRGSRYFSWLDIVTIHDRVTGEQQIGIVQRLTDDDQRMEDRAWKILMIAQNGEVNEEVVTYSQRQENPLGVKLINFSGTVLMSMGYYSDIMKGYPSLIFPFVYPFGSALIGLVLLWVGLKKRNPRRLSP